MNDRSSGADVGVAVDNDIIKKTVCYGIARLVWADEGEKDPVGVLGAAQYVVRDAIRRVPLEGDHETALRRLRDVLSTSVVLEPTERELELASDMETIAQQAGFALDAGESQLAAIAIERQIGLVQTGDKRAIIALEKTLDAVEAAAALSGKVQCLEQIVLDLVTASAHGEVAEAICSEPSVDMTLTICFACSSGGAAPSVVVEGLCSYITDARNAAPRVLAP